MRVLKDDGVKKEEDEDEDEEEGEIWTICNVGELGELEEVCGSEVLLLLILLATYVIKTAIYIIFLQFLNKLFQNSNKSIFKVMYTHKAILLPCNLWHRFSLKIQLSFFNFFSNSLKFFACMKWRTYTIVQFACLLLVYCQWMYSILLVMRWVSN